MALGLIRQQRVVGLYNHIALRESHGEQPLEGASYMSKRKGAVALAACALLAIGGIARAADPVPTTSFESQPLSLADTAPAGPESVLNEQVLDKTPAGKFLKDTGIKVGGWVEGSWTYNFRAPRSDINEGRVFDFEHNAARLNQIAL